MARVSLRITNAHTVNAEFWEEHAGALKRSWQKGCLLKGPRDTFVNDVWPLLILFVVQKLKIYLNEWGDMALTKGMPKKRDETRVIYYLNSLSTTTRSCHGFYLLVKILKVGKLLIDRNQKTLQILTATMKWKPSQGLKNHHQHKPCSIGELSVKKRNDERIPQESRIRNSPFEVYQLMNNLWVEGNMREMTRAILQPKSSCWKTTLHPPLYCKALAWEQK